MLKQIGKKNPSLIERLASWAQSMLSRFTDRFHTKKRGLNTEQRNRMFDVFGKVFRQIEDANGNKIFRYNRRTHEIEHIDGRKLETVDTSGKTKLSFVGEKAKTANKETLKRAKKMDERGAHRDRIYEETGRFKGKDGKWRFEIPDNRKQMNIHKLVERGNFGKETPLEEIYDNPELFAAYPKLRGIKTKAVDPADDGVESDLVRDCDAAIFGKTIFFNMDRIFDDMDECQKILVHEIQHIIQDYEKFSSGGNYEQIKEIKFRTSKNILTRYSL